jgi:hypothetical protein
MYVAASSTYLAKAAPLPASYPFLAGKVKPMTLWKKYSLGITLLILFIADWVLITWTSWNYFSATQHEHGSAA